MAMISDAMLLHRLANVRERAEGLLEGLGTMPDRLYRHALPPPGDDDDRPARVLPDAAQTWEAARQACGQAIAALRTLELVITDHLRV
jgi:hypothetical protein